MTKMRERSQLLTFPLIVIQLFMGSSRLEHVMRIDLVSKELCHLLKRFPCTRGDGQIRIIASSVEGEMAPLVSGKNA